MKDVDPGLDARPVASESTAGKGTTPFPVVGIGASAGGLAAFEAFFSAMPPATDSGMSFVLVQHLAPDHKSILSDLVRRYTRMPVFDVEDGMQVQPSCVYVIPPNRDLALVEGTLRLLDPMAPRGQRLPIDFFFRSLAQAQRERAICIILSGTGSDGTLGLRAVKGEGGMVMVQSQESTEHDGMPRSAIATGLVDYVLAPAEMPAQLIAYARHAFGEYAQRAPGDARFAESVLHQIFALLRAQTGHDFSGYKRSTIVRRVERRMAVHQIEGLEPYLRTLQDDPAEVQALFRDLLIGVTSFFRDPEAFEALERRALVPLLDRPSGAPIRVWVPGCSTGEEAYSITILLQEQLQARKSSLGVQVFATDLDGRAIDHARRGVYPDSIAADVSAERLARFFAEEPGHDAYRIRKSIRDVVVFSEHDVLRDPPFSRLDLISCRNLMIYLGPELQQTLIPRFHYSLNPGGYLLLGSSETVGDFADLFEPLDRPSRLYRRRAEALEGSRPTEDASRPAASERRANRRPPARRAGPVRASLRDLTERALLRQYAAAAALVDERGDILYVHGRTGQYLEPAPGEAGLNVLKMAREGLHQELVVALQHVVAHAEVVRRPGLRVKTNGGFSSVDLTVAPAGVGPDAPSRLFLVILQIAPPADPAAPVPTAEIPLRAGDGEAADTAPMRALRQELQAKEDYLQTLNEELETSNEELRSFNEEMQSVNEELQSANEELETSKEELQSVNEELATVNAELQQKVADLSRANNDMNNLLAGTDIGTIFVDHELRISRFTPSAVQVINLIPTDIGRPVGHIVSNLVGYDRLVEDLQAVLDSLVPREVEVQTRAGKWYSLRIRPYRTLDNAIEGAVVTFIDIDEVKRMRAGSTDDRADGGRAKNGDRA